MVPILYEIFNSNSLKVDYVYKVFYCGLFEQFRHFCQMCYAAQKLPWQSAGIAKLIAKHFFCPAWRLEWNYRNHTISSNLRTCIGGSKDWWAGNSHASSEWGYNFFRHTQWDEKIIFRSKQYFSILLFFFWSSYILRRPQNFAKSPTNFCPPM